MMVVGRRNTSPLEATKFHRDCSPDLPIKDGKYVFSDRRKCIHLGDTISRQTKR